MKKTSNKHIKDVNDMFTVLNWFNYFNDNDFDFILINAGFLGDNFIGLDMAYSISYKLIDKYMHHFRDTDWIMLNVEINDDFVIKHFDKLKRSDGSIPYLEFQGGISKWVIEQLNLD